MRVIDKYAILLGMWSLSGLALAQSAPDEASHLTNYAMQLRKSILFRVEPQHFDPFVGTNTAERYPWHTGIVTTTFWIGEGTSANNPVRNEASAWDLNWVRNYGGVDGPQSNSRVGFIPAAFVPRLNPFYIALPYNDVSLGRTKPEAASVIPWFNEDFVRAGQSVLKGRWIVIRKGNLSCYAQWEDVGPFRTDHWEYVFGSERPRPNLNRGAGLDVSPAVRDYLKIGPSDVTDWKFVETNKVPPGPWALYGANNPFVIDREKREAVLAKLNAAGARNQQ